MELLRSVRPWVGDVPPAHAKDVERGTVALPGAPPASHGDQSSGGGVRIRAGRVAAPAVSHAASSCRGATGSQEGGSYRD